MRLPVLLALASAAIVPPLSSYLSAQVAPAPFGKPAPAVIPFDKADADKAVSDLATALNDNFVFPDAGSSYAAMLRANLAAGRYASFPDADSFAERVTADLQAVHKDGHLRLRPIPAGMRSRQEGEGRQGGEREASAVGKNGWISDGVAYIETKGFPGDEATLADVRKFLAAHREAKALIIDARGNGGGGLDEMNLIFREIFAEPTTLVTMDIRQAVEEKRGTPFGEDPTLRKVSGPPTIVRREHFVTPATAPSPLRNAKVYLLTSKNTFSAAEHLSLSLKRTGRAVLVGEATGGGAHFGGMIPMGDGYAAFIPVGRTFDPDTGQSWEGVGVKPDVDVPADQALAEVLRRVGAKVDAKVALASLRK
jgi:hypothetical protein